MTRDSKKPHVSVFVLIDALGWQFLEQREFLNRLLTFRTPLRTVLGFSSGAIPTILTGVSPSQHGHWNLFYYDPQQSAFRWLRYFSFLPNAVLDNRISRKLIKELGRRVLGLGSSFECCVGTRLLPYFDFAEKKSLYACDGITGAPSIFDRLAAAEIPFRVYSYHFQSDAAILAQARRDIESEAASFYFIYLSEMDRFLHEHCDDERGLSEKLAWYSAGLLPVFEAALQRDPEAGLTITSDHGMTPVRHNYDLIRDVESLGFTMPDDYLAVYDSTMARFWFFSERARAGIPALLDRVPCGRVLPDDELKSLGVFFPDRRYGELVMLLNPGWIFARSDFNGSRWRPVGMHGYHPDDPASNAIFLSNHRPLLPVSTIADVYQCMQREAGLVDPGAMPRTKEFASIGLDG